MLFHSRTVISSSSVGVTFMLVFEMSGDYSARTFAVVITNDFCTNLLQQLIYTYTVRSPYTLKFGAFETPVNALFSLYFCQLCIDYSSLSLLLRENDSYTNLSKIHHHILNMLSLYLRKLAIGVQQ